jgi:hypothetical protein
MNMNHCRFHNTLIDLEQVAESDDLWDDTELSETESKARKKLIRLCIEISNNFVDDEEFEDVVRI